jgi:hypothetical protein
MTENILDRARRYQEQNGYGNNNDIGMAFIAGAEWQQDNEPNWEQRKYELIKTVLTTTSNINTVDKVVSFTFETVNRIIKKLQDENS